MKQMKYILLRLSIVIIDVIMVAGLHARSASRVQKEV